MDMVKAQGLSYEYIKTWEGENGTKEERVLALKDLDLSIPKGQFIAVLGHNGSGKSTFAKHINALLLPSQGVLFVKGYDTKKEELLWKIRQSAGMVFQNPDNQIVATVVEEDVAFGPENMGVPQKELRRRVDEALETVQMTEYKKHSPAKLSGGQKQRIAIAGVLAMKPDCIVLDEPTAMLDPVGRKEVMDTVLRLNREEGITMILITHYMDEAVQAHRVSVIDDGVIVMQGTPKEIFPQVETLKKYGLDVPQVTEAVYQLRKAGFSLPQDVLTVEEMVEAILSSADFSRLKEGHLLPVKKEEQKCPAETKKVPVLELKNISYLYNPGTVFEKKALDDVSLTIYEGEFIGLIGHTGSGKSTLIQHLNALIRPSSGEIFLQGENIYADKSKMKTVRQKVGLVFQYPEHQLFEMSIYKDVAYGPINLGLSREEVDRRVRQALKTVGIGETMFEKSPFDLSGGQKRRVAIAGILAMEPRVLILDEPTAGLDPRGRDEILSAVKQMHQVLGITVILVSHSMEDVAKLVERILVMHKGKLALSGTPRQVFSHVTELESMGLAVPQISYVFQRLKDKGIQVPTDIYTVEEATAFLSAAAKGELV